MKDHSMHNPFFRAVTTDGTKVDINLSTVLFFAENSDGGTTIYFVNGNPLSVKESAQTVRGRTRKTWPDEVTITSEA